MTSSEIIGLCISAFLTLGSLSLFTLKWQQQGAGIEVATVVLLFAPVSLGFACGLGCFYDTFKSMQETLYFGCISIGVWAIYNLINSLFTEPRKLRHSN